MDINVQGPLGQSGINSLNDTSKELEQDVFLKKTYTLLKTGVTQNQSQDYVTGEIQTLVKQNPQLAKQFNLPDDFQDLKQKIVAPWYQNQTSLIGEKNSRLQLIGTLNPKQTNKLIETKVNLTQWPDELKKYITETDIEKAIAQGIKNKNSIDDMANILFKQLPTDLQTEANKNHLVACLDDNLNQITLKGAEALSQKGEDFIKNWEQFKPTMYDNDGGKNTTIGFGHLVHEGKIDNSPSEQRFKKGITREEADALFKEDAAKYVQMVNTYITVPLTQNQFDSLVSFAFNLGELPDSIIRLVNGGKIESAEFKNLTARYHYSKGKSVPGLINRRADEWDMVKNNDYKRQ